MLLPDHDSCYAALKAHDRRFDGRLFVGVTSTRIYCRPVCAVRMPKQENCRFFSNPAAAESAGFRPCLRCRPELAPGWAWVDAAGRLAAAAVHLIEAGELATGGLPDLAARLGVTDRHLRRVFKSELGVSPVAYAQTQRLLLAKRLLVDTSMPVTRVALAAGFGSLRRFNEALRSRYGLTPSDLRRAARSGAREDDETLRFQLAYRPPYDWDRLLGFLEDRTIVGVETVAGGTWARTVRIVRGDTPVSGWIKVAHRPGHHALEVEVSTSLAQVLPAVLSRVRRVFDLSCEPQIVAEALGEIAADAPGLRVPGAFDGFEMAVRAVLGQQVTVAAAHTIAGRLSAAFGDPIATPVEGLDRLFPHAADLAGLDADQIASLGIVRQRASAIRAVADEVVAGRLDLSPAADVAVTVRRLCAVPGIGEWTAQYIALRALAWPDAWPSGDSALMKALNIDTRREADARAEAWRPWRSYATLQLWRCVKETAP
jgi:AraC family transcriptional regulator of adaptative response / DNA-3-methyladenine glycosylase II